MISPTDVNVETDLTDRVQGAMGDEPNRKVVFCDDSAVARRTVNQCLTALGVEGISFENGEQTWNYLQLLAETPGGLDTVICLISDIEMPQLDGFTLTQKIRNHEKLSNLSVYLHSSLSGDFNETRAMQVGADGFITKVNPDLIADSIARSLEQSAEKLRLAAQ